MSIKSLTKIGKHTIYQKLKAVKDEIKKLDAWLEYNNLADEAYFSILRRKRELLLKKQQLTDRLDPRKQSAYLPDRFEIIK